MMMVSTDIVTKLTAHFLVVFFIYSNIFEYIFAMRFSATPFTSAARDRERV